MDIEELRQLPLIVDSDLRLRSDKLKGMDTAPIHILLAQMKEYIRRMDLLIKTVEERMKEKENK